MTFIRERMTFTRQQIIWVEQHFKELSDGFWPEGVTRDWPPLVIGHIFYSAGWKPSELAFEVELRLSKCGPLDGLLVDAFYRYGVPMGKLARVAQMSQEELERRTDRALDYVRGAKFWSKRRSYQECIAHGRGSEAVLSR